ncbi:MAG: DNA polymerase II [Myxococcota bacterium]
MSETREGFVLTRAWRDTSRGLVLTLWLTTPEGPVRAVIRREQAVFFVVRGTPSRAPERREVALTSLKDQPVDALYFPSRRAALDEAQRLRAEGQTIFESDVKPHDRFLMERFVAGSCRVRGTFTRGGEGFDVVHDPKLTGGDHIPDLRVLSLDLETDGRDGPIIAAALADGDGKSLVLMVTSARGLPAPIRPVDDEKALLLGLMAEVQRRDPDVLTGWNVVGFDLQHLERRCQHHRVPFDLGRGGERATILPPSTGAQLPTARIPGRAVVDGIRALEAATYRFESFALEDVAQSLLGRGKEIDHGVDKVAEIQRMHRDDPAALGRYNQRDAELVVEILAATDVLTFMVARQNMTGLPLSRVGGSVAAFDHLYLPRLHREGHVAGDTEDVPRVRLAAPGGLVLPSRPGLYRNVAVFDFKSLYPSIIRTFRIDPMGMAFPGVDPIEGYDGAMFSRDRHILPALIERLWRERDDAKRAHDGPRSTAIKILMNSFYGVLGTPGCRFFDLRLCSSITRRGHDIIRATRDRVADRGYDVIYGDTDSLFVWLGDDRPVDDGRATATALATDLNAWWTERIKDAFGVSSALELEFETYFERFFMPTLRGSDEGSAKRYAGLATTAEGKADVIIKGLEAVRTDWTPLARRFQRELLSRVFHDEPLEAWIRGVRRSLFSGELDDELVYRKRLRRRVEDYQHQVPPHVRAAMRLGRPVKVVEYVITHDGPEPIALPHGPIDHRHYLDRQLAPAAAGILQVLGLEFQAIAGDQLGLF